MRFGRISAAALAAVMMASSTAIVASAVEQVVKTPAENPQYTNKMWFFRLVTENEDQALYKAANSKVLEAYGARFTIKADDSLSGTIALNSNSTGWDQKDWTITWNDDKTEAVVEFIKKNAPLFKETDKYAQVIIAGWSGLTSVDKIEIVNKDGEALWSVSNNGDDTWTENDAKYKGMWEGTDPSVPAEEPAAEDTAEEETKEEAKEETAADDIAAAIDEAIDNLSEEDKAALQGALDTITEEDLAELDAALEQFAASLEELMSMYDAEAAAKNNANFELGGKIDLLAALGADWDKFTKVEADFTWTPGTGWCGGAGIGGGADVEGGSGWISGPEFGAANANEGVVNDGKATQTIIDLEGKHLSQVAALNEDGTVSFGEMQIQKWWNCDEANAKILAIRFLGDDGSVIAELKAPVTEEAAPVAEVAVTTGDVAAATDSKGNPDTGIADVAAVAGLAVVAGGAIVISKKRK